MSLIKKIKNRIAFMYASLLNYSLFEEEKEEKLKTEHANLISPDFIDYDGMGNQGRFPSRKKK